MRAICVDTGFLIGLYDLSDDFHDKAKKHFLDLLDSSPNHLLIPRPVLYETVSTRMVKNRPGLTQMQNDWKRLLVQRRLNLVSDVSYRETLADECFNELTRPTEQYRNLSAVDRIIRRMLSDNNLRISAFLTFNPKDFSDVCRAIDCELYC